MTPTTKHVARESSERMAAPVARCVECDRPLAADSGDDLVCFECWSNATGHGDDE